MQIVQGIAQVVGLYNIPASPRDMEGLRNWYYEVGMPPVGHVLCLMFISLTTELHRHRPFHPQHI